MVSQAARQLCKHTLSLFKVKLLYTRITLTRYTTFYFFLAFGTCIVLSALQAVAFVDTSKAVSILTPLLKDAPMTEILLLHNGALKTCSSIPNQPGTNCTVNLVFGQNVNKREISGLQWERRDDDEDDDHDDDESESDDHDDDESESDDHKILDVTLPSITASSSSTSTSLSTPASASTSVSSSSTTSAASSSSTSALTSDNCVRSLSWLQEILEDSKREDIVTFFFQLWLFSVSLVTILNESIPHLGAALFGHILGTAWAGYRIQSSHSLMDLYRNHIVPEACGGSDVLGGWWDIRIHHAIPIVIINALVLIAFVYVSMRLYKVYATESFGRVGASTVIHRVYKIVLLFSVGLQLSGFFTLASSAMWIDEVCHGPMKALTIHSKLYLAAFIVTLVFQLPWLYVGWVCVRRECRIRFGTFCAISAFLLTISTLMFFSPLYRYIFISWPFFATVTVTAYILSAGTSVLAIICRLNFGKGLAHYLQVTEALEGVDFTPVSFFKGYDNDPEKVVIEEKSNKGSDSGKVTVPLPAMARQPPTIGRQRGSSIYSDSQDNPIILSSSPPLVSELGPAPSVKRGRSTSRSSRRKASTILPPGLNHSPATSERASSETSMVAYPVPAARSPGSIRSGTGDAAVLTRTPTRSSSITSRASSRRKLQKQGLPTNPRPVPF